MLKKLIYLIDCLVEEEKLEDKKYNLDKIILVLLLHYIRNNFLTIIKKKKILIIKNYFFDGYLLSIKIKRITSYKN